MKMIRGSWMVLIITLLFGALMMAYFVPKEMVDVADQLVGFPDSDIFTHSMRPWVMAAMCFLPFIGALYYHFAECLDRYFIRCFVSAFGLTLTALITILIIMDMQENVEDFTRTAHPFFTFLQYYATRFPAFLLLLLPYALLLSLLQLLGKLSNEREIIAALQSGRSLLRITLPFIMMGLLISLFSFGLNYHWAPVAEGKQANILSQAQGKDSVDATKVLYKDTLSGRLWMVGVFPSDYQKGKPLKHVEITTVDESHQLKSRMIAASASWNANDRVWRFHHAKLCHFSKDMPPQYTILPEWYEQTGWTETPWQIIKPGLKSAYLGVPDLTSWLISNQKNRSAISPNGVLTQWHYRFALPFSSIITVLIATPLAVHFSRRGPGSGILLAIILSALILFLGSLSLSLGEAGIVPPVIAAWVTNVIFALIGLYFYYRRSTGRPIYQSVARLFSRDNY